LPPLGPLQINPTRSCISSTQGPYICPSASIMKTLKDQIVWITGASSGIGAALSLAFAYTGARLVLSARRKDKLEEVAANCNLPDAHILILPIDLEHSEQAPEWVAKVIQHFGRIDVLINNTGIGQIGYVADMTDAV
jgi:short-subunit dehydrogenase